MRVIGVDPGTVATGWGVVDEVGDRLGFIAGGVIRPRGSLPERLGKISVEIERLVAEYQPDALSLEKSFVGDNMQTAFRLGEARGAILAVVARAGIDIAEYAPAAIKVSVAGGGRATKDQMQRMVGHLLSVEPHLPADEADALGAAICHLHCHRLAALVGPAPAARRSVRGRGWR